MSTSGSALLGVDTCLNATMMLAAWRKAGAQIENLSARFIRHTWPESGPPRHYGIGEIIPGTNYQVVGVALYATESTNEKQDLTLINDSNVNLQIDQKLIYERGLLVLRTTVNRV